MKGITNLNVEERLVKVRLDSLTLEGNLNVPVNARGVIVFAHGSGSSRLSPRNRYVADFLNRGRFATLLFDLLAPEEEEIDRATAHLRFNIPFLANRLVGATEWLTRNLEIPNFKIGYFGASTGAAAALVAAKERPEVVNAIVSRGGRPDLAGEHLAAVAAPTLLIVGGRDLPVIAMNREALARLPKEKELVIVPEATHLFPEPGALEAVASLALEWFDRYLS